MNRETKDVIQLLAFMLPMMGLVTFGWFHSPMYYQAMKEERAAAQLYLIKTQYDQLTAIDRQELIDHYNFTDEEINSSKIMEALIEHAKTN